MKIGEYEVKEGLLYSINYWVKPEGNIATIGITDAAAKMAKDIAFIELPQVGKEIVRGKGIGVIESAKWSGEIISHVSGKVVEVNSALEADPSMINKDPYGKGWIAKIELSNKDELKTLKDTKTYAEELGKEVERRK